MEKQSKYEDLNPSEGMSKLKPSGKGPTSVEEIMTAKVITLLPSNSLNDAIAMMANNTFRHFIVVELDGQLAGVVSDRDLLRAMNHRRDWAELMISEFMTQEIVTVRKETPLSEAVEQIITRRINCLPVVDDKNRVCGIVTSTDLLQVLQMHLE